MLACRFLQPPARQWVEVAWGLMLLRHPDATQWPQNQKRHPGAMAVRYSPPLDQPPAVTAVLSRLRCNLADWQRRYHLTAIGLFGSVARGEQRPGSDIDIWVQLDPLTPYALVHLKHELEDLLQAPVDVVRLRETMNPALQQRIKRDGVRT